MPFADPVRLAGITLVSHDRSWGDIRPDVHQGLEMTSIRCFAASQIKGDEVPAMVCFRVELGREAATQTAEGLSFLPPFAPAADTCARTMVESNIWTRCADGLIEATHHTVDWVGIDEPAVVNITVSQVEYQVEGSAGVTQLYGSASDRHAGEGAEMEEQFPIELRFTVPIETPHDLDKAEVLHDPSLPSSNKHAAKQLDCLSSAGFAFPPPP